MVVVEDLVVEVVLLPKKVHHPPHHSRTAAPPWGHLEQGCCWLCGVIWNLLAAWGGGRWVGLAE